MSPKKRQAIVSGRESNEVIVKLALLAVQPAGDVGIYEITPQSAQNKESQDYQKASKELKEKLKIEMQPYAEALKNQAGQHKGGLEIKVLFLLAKNEAEKDLDNMAKWFLDCLKEATGCDDSAVCDLRILKARLEHHEESYVGMTVATPNAKRGDKMSASMMAIMEAKGVTPPDLEDIKSVIKRVQSKLEQGVNPQFSG